MGQTLTEIRAMLERAGLRPRKMFGQNFLIDHNLLTRLVELAGVGAGDDVLEVGPGTGVLTEALLARGANVLAVEVDRGLCRLLEERLAGPWSRRGRGGWSCSMPTCWPARGRSTRPCWRPCASAGRAAGGW